MPAAACTVCRLPLPPTEVPGGFVECPQCGTANGAGGTPGACPHCAAAVEPDAAACGACGELLGPLGGRRRSAGVSTGGAFRAAFRDWLRHGVRIGGLVLMVALIWTTLLMTQTLAAALLGGLGSAVGLYGDWPFIVAYVLAALCALPLNCATLLGLHRTNLDIARGERPRPTRAGGESWAARFFRNRGKRRLLACGGTLAFFAAGMGTVGGFAVLFIAEVLLPARPYLTDELTALAAALPTFALWVLFWPVPYLILDRPDLRGLRPLRECPRIAAGGWGGYMAAGVASGVLVAVALAPWGLLLPVFGPAAGLLTAHAYDRMARSEPMGPLTLDG